ncbi:hypothetical protein [Nocardia speluncae]|nr:hypothetical protein [Nocardia speluncae]
MNLRDSRQAPSVNIRPMLSPVSLDYYTDVRARVIPNLRVWR